jgi:hypothetical protein
MSEEHPLSPRINSVEQRIIRIEEKIDDIHALDGALRDLASIARNMESQQKVMWERIDDFQKWRMNHSDDDREEHEKILLCAKETTDKIAATAQTVSDRVTKWVATFNGGMRVATAVGGFILAALSGTAVWQFNKIERIDHDFAQIQIKLEEHLRVDQCVSRGDCK